jgi:putative aldouronate transport system substrate-binding protein
MKAKKIVSLILSGMMLANVLAGCGSSGGTSSQEATGKSASEVETTAENTSSKENTKAEAASSDDIDTKFPGLTDEEKEAVQDGLIRLDGTMPAVTNPDEFESKYGNIKMFVHYTGGRTRPVQDLAIVKVWEDLTGIRFDWQDVPYDGVAEKINLTLSASGDDMPDCFYNFVDGQSGNFAVQFSDQDVFVPTEDIINNYMPHYKALLDSKPEYVKEATAPDGHIYGFPYVEEMKGLVLTPGPVVINKTWLDKVGLDVPTNIDELVTALKAFKEAGDLNGNGEEDETPMAIQVGAHDTFGSNDLFYRFTSMFGQADSYCGGNPYADHLYLDDDGKVQFSATNDAFKKTADFFHQLYSDGLIWNGSFESDSSLSFENSLLKQDVATVGVYSTWGGRASIPNLDVRNQYVAIPRLEGEAGKMGFRLNFSELQDTSNCAITTNCKFPHLIAVWLDAIAADPKLSVQSNWGTVGSVFEEQDDGFLLKPTDENGNTYALGEFADGKESARENTTPCRGSFIIKDSYYDDVCTYDALIIYDDQVINGKEDILKEYENHIIPKMLNTVEESNRLSQIQPTISDIVDRYEADWIINGVTDDSWNQYKTDLSNAGEDELVSIWQGAVDRYNAE